MNEYESIKHYLKDLKKSLKGLDTALIADALDDAEEHLELAVKDNIESGKFESKSDALNTTIKEYGLPSDIAFEYRMLESEKKMEKTETKKHSLLFQICGVYLEKKTYLNVTYLLLQFPLGLLYFLYIVPAVLLIAVLFITWVGIPLGVLFLFSIFALSWFHGRVSEAFLGIRMPQKKRRLLLDGATQQNSTGTLGDFRDITHFTSTKTWEKIKAILKDMRLYTSMCYLLLTFPLGIIYFVGFVALFSSAISLIIPPIADTILESISMELFEGTWAQLGLTWIGTTSYTVAYPVLGFILLTGTLHLCNMVVVLHGRMTKRLLVKR
ncbi:MAG: sensor domain-containing protein [Theionarchaea archaeon]|nr:sensor domain-containing protein [Theionarchaea archaeon]